jgi:hypothetical protein
LKLLVFLGYVANYPRASTKGAKSRQTRTSGHFWPGAGPSTGGRPSGAAAPAAWRCWRRSAASLRLILQALQHQGETERDAEIDHVDAGSGLLKLRGDVTPGWIIAAMNGHRCGSSLFSQIGAAMASSARAGRIGDAKLG